jgi:hypothetical protein
MKRLLVVFAAAGAVMAAAATPALADAPPNGNNCLGSTVSGQTPGVVRDGAQGDRASQLYETPAAEAKSTCAPSSVADTLPTNVWLSCS